MEKRLTLLPCMMHSTLNATARTLYRQHIGISICWAKHDRKPAARLTAPGGKPAATMDKKLGKLESPL